MGAVIREYCHVSFVLVDSHTSRLQIVALSPPFRSHVAQIYFTVPTQQSRFLETLIIFLSDTIAVVYGHWDRGNEVYMAEVRPNFGSHATH